MKKIIISSVVIASAVLFYNCHSSKKASSGKHALTFNTELKTVIIDNCSPCHIPAKGGNKKAYDNFENVKADIDDIIRRIEMKPEDRGFMPFKHAKLPDATIAVFTQWKADGMKEN